jgi:hypothetical protein
MNGRLTGQQLRRGARRDQRVEAGHRATGDGDEQEREHALPHRAGAVDDWVSAGIFSSGMVTRMPMARATMVPIFRKVDR